LRPDRAALTHDLTGASLAATDGPMDSRRSTVKGRVVEVDICEREVGFVLSVGPVSLWLGPAIALDVLETLARAVAARRNDEAGERAAPDPLAALRRRIFS